MSAIAKNEALVSTMELDSTKALDLHIKTSDILALILTVLGVILFIAYPLYQVGEDSFSMFSIKVICHKKVT